MSIQNTEYMIKNFEQQLGNLYSDFNRLKKIYYEKMKKALYIGYQFGFWQKLNIK